MNILLIQPAWPKNGKISNPQKYFPFPLIKLASYYRKLGHDVSLIVDDPVNHDQGGLFTNNMIPWSVVHRCVITTVFSYWYPYVKECIERYVSMFPEAEVHIGGIHASLSPEVYKKQFPNAYVHVGTVPEAEALEPSWDLLPSHINTQILRYSSGCIRRCSFCTGWREGYQAFKWDDIAPKIRFNKLILNDNNFMAHPDCRFILQKLADFRVNGKPISSIEIQGGWDPRLLVKNLDVIPLMKAARLNNIRLAWDGGLEHRETIETCLEALHAAGYSMRDIRCFMLYNYDLSFEMIIKKLEYFAKWQLGPSHSRYRPYSILSDGYVKQKRHQDPGEDYIHPGWTDEQIRVVGSLSSDISRMARAGKDSLDEVRQYYGRPTVAQTISKVSVC